MPYAARVKAGYPHAGAFIWGSEEMVPGKQFIESWGPEGPEDWGQTDFWFDGNTQAKDERGVRVYVLDDASVSVPGDQIEIVEVADEEGPEGNPVVLRVVGDLEPRRDPVIPVSLSVPEALAVLRAARAAPLAFDHEAMASAIAKVEAAAVRLVGDTLHGSAL